MFTTVLGPRRKTSKRCFENQILSYLPIIIHLKPTRVSTNYVILTRIVPTAFFNYTVEFPNGLQKPHRRIHNPAPLWSRVIKLFKLQKYGRPCRSKHMAYDTYRIRALTRTKIKKYNLVLVYNFSANFNFSSVFIR